ncbi:MAG: hypothetical protein CMI55_04300 [Parcubacteria group bacterium]|jgi:uncharacterized membrane-anchored protein|nr:hypothetical protein [Parcubacteria group bacterium]|tara:strand:+ start:2237 stop:2815 length:579 start_codon:yes stop_codon:yes gene_type:complete
MLTKQSKFIIAIGIQVLIILIMIIFKLAVLTGGTEVILRIEPVDPRDPLRGDYVTFQYDISNISSYQLRDASVQNGQTVYVVLRSGYGGSWRVSEVLKNKPSNNSVFIKGAIKSGADQPKPESFLIKGVRQIPEDNFEDDLNIVYGIEEYFIPEGAGRDFNFWNKDVLAKVILDENGNAIIKQIFVDGNPWP